MMRQIRVWLCFFSFLASVAVANAQPLAGSSPVARQNGLENLLVSKAGGMTVLKISLREPLSAPPSNFSTANPARLVFDLPATENALGYSSKAINEGGLRSLNVVQAGDRSRLVLNLDKLTRFETRQEDKTLVITLLDEAVAVTDSSGMAAQHFAGSEQAAGQSIRDIKFRRGKDGVGSVVIDLSAGDTGIDIVQKGATLQVAFRKTSLPEHLRRQLDVADFATPIKLIKTRATGEDVNMEIVPSGLWEYNAFQGDNQFIVEVRPVKEDPNKLIQGSRGGYQGEPINLEFQSVPVYDLLSVFAEISNFNIIASDSVKAVGSVTLRMRDVPWDQALDTVLTMKNLAKRKSGNVIWIAPSKEIQEMEAKELESRQQISQLEPVRTEAFQIKYQKAEDVVKLLTNKDQPLLSKAGSVVFDTLSNQIFVNDVPSSLDKVRELIAMIDKATEQVLLEARIVEARDNYGRDLGVRLGLLNTRPVVAGRPGGNDLLIGGGTPLTTTTSTGELANTNFSIPDPMGTLNFSLFNASLTRILSLELEAMETDGRGKTMSNPRVVTRNNVKALIEQGDEIPVVTPGAANSPPTVTYRKAKLSFEVTPQITSDKRVKMKLIISRDRPDWGNTVNGNPTIVTAKVETEVLVENGGTLVIGGVTLDQETKSTDRIPFLGDLPYVGFMFKATQVTRARNELLVFITPKIVDENLRLR